jgi:hypothetical protein
MTLLRQKQIAALPRTDDVAFALRRGARTDAIRAAHAGTALGIVDQPDLARV